MEGGQARLDLLVDVGSISASMLAIRPNVCEKGIGDGRRDAR
jgi:hypothetical protein